MSLILKIVSKEQIAACKYIPDEHTVSLRDNGIWYALEKNGILVSFLCIRVQRNELYIGEVFTAQKYRKRGYFFRLLDYVVNTIYAGYSISTHALITSKNGFLACGFKQFAFRRFKYGDQYWLRREGKKWQGQELK